MGSTRLRDNVKQLFECFCEVAAPVLDKPAWILQKYPESFIDKEILKSVPKFAYPCEIENSAVQHFSFVLTSIDSRWTFGFCRHDPKTETALVILSALPWHEVFYKLLNHVAAVINSSSSKDNLWKFLQDVYNSGVPSAGSSLTVPLPDALTVFVCPSPKLGQLPSIPENRNLTEYYSAVDPHNMMIVFASMLYERRIVFTSKRLSRLSACVQACNALIYPMIWQHIFIPVLPVSLMDYLLAPMPFLIGVPAPTFERVKKSDLGEVVVLNADTNKIESPFQDLETLPIDVVSNLRKALRNRSGLLGDGVSRAFLRALVQLTAGYKDALVFGESISFDQNAFVLSRPATMQPFLRKMLELQIFQQFIEERLAMFNSGLGFTDEFEIEALNYSDKSSSVFMQQYREWTHAMRKEGSAFIKSVKDKANPAVMYAVKSVKGKGKDMKSAYKGLKWKGRSSKNDHSAGFPKPRSAPSSPTMERRPMSINSPSKSPSSFAATTSYRKDFRFRNSNTAETSRQQYSPLKSNSQDSPLDSPLEVIDINLMHELKDVIFPTQKAVVSNDQTSETQDLITLDAPNSDDEFDPLYWKKLKSNSSKQMTQSLNIPDMGEGLSNPLYPYFVPANAKENKTHTQQHASDNSKDFYLLQEYGIDFQKFNLSDNSTSSSASTRDQDLPNTNFNSITNNAFMPTFNSSVIQSQSNWTKFE